MNRLVLLALLLLPALGLQAKKKPTPTRQYIYRYYLTDKAGTPYSLSSPEAWLSARSLERRRRQGLSLDSTDLPVSPHYVATLQREGVEVVGTSRWNNTVLLCSSDSLLLERLGRKRFVREHRLVWTSPDTVDLPFRKNIHEYFNRWDSVHNDPYGSGRPQIEMLGGIPLHEAGFRGQGMLIAVLDGGFHNIDRLPQLSNVRIEGVRDMVRPIPGVEPGQAVSALRSSDDDQPSVSAALSAQRVAAFRQIPRTSPFFVETDHGTKVLSTMAANLPEVLVGTAPDASYWLIRSEDSQSEQAVEEDYWAMAAELADSVGADILSSSLGYTEYDDPRQSYHINDLNGRTALVSRTAAMLAGKGMVLCNSAGNSGMGVWKKIGVPADAPDVLAVGALTPEGVVAAFSSIGPSQDGRVKPDVMAQGSPTALISGRGSLSHDMGTSFSCPVTSGMVACLWQALPEKTALEIMDLVRRSADNYQTPNNIYGYGIPNFWKAYQTALSERPAPTE